MAYRRKQLITDGDLSGDIFSTPEYFSLEENEWLCTAVALWDGATADGVLRWEFSHDYNPSVHTDPNTATWTPLQRGSNVVEFGKSPSATAADRSAEVFENLIGWCRVAYISNVGGIGELLNLFIEFTN